MKEPSIEKHTEPSDAQKPPELIQQISQGAASTSSSSANTRKSTNKHESSSCLCLTCICKRRSSKKQKSPRGKLENIELNERPEKPNTLATEMSGVSLAMTNVQSHQSIKSHYMNESDIAHLKAAYINGSLRFRNTNNMIQNYEVS